MPVHYLEIVTNDVDALTALYQSVHGLSFGPPNPDLGQARWNMDSGNHGKKLTLAKTGSTSPADP